MLWLVTEGWVWDDDREQSLNFDLEVVALLCASHVTSIAKEDGVKGTLMAKI